MNHGEGLEYRNNKKVLIITLNYNQNEYTLHCVKSVLNSNYREFTIYLIDNGSTVENFLKLQKTLPHDDRIMLARLEINRGYVGGINYGFDFALNSKFDYIIVMNNDIIVDESAIENSIITCINHTNSGIVAGKVYDYTKKNQLQTIGKTFKNPKMLEFVHHGQNITDNGQYENELEMDSLDDIFWIFPKQLLHEIGGYSKYFWFNSEQLDFALRAKKMGYKLIYSPKIKVWHKGSVSIGGRNFNPVLAYWNIQSSLILLYLHLTKSYFILAYIKVVLSVVSTLVKSTLMLLKGDNRMRYAFAKLRGLNYFNRWVFIRNENVGFNPFVEKKRNLS